MDIANTLQTLFKDYGELPGIFIEVQKDLVAIGINNAAAKAEIFLQGAQVTAYQRHRQSPILFLSDANQHKLGSPLRGGIPLCWPWFGNLHNNPKAITRQFDPEAINSAPAHGLVRDKQWTVKSIATPHNDLTIVELSLTLEKDQETLWPFKSELLYTVEVGEKLKTYLQITNTDTQRFSFSTALHSYFSVNAIAEVTVSGLDDVTYYDALDQWQEKLQQGNIRFDGEVDRVYQNCPSTVAIKENKRTVVINSHGSKSCVVWNPWIEKAKTLSQFKPDDYLKMVCIETANAGSDTVNLEPNASHTLGVSILP